MAKIKNTKIPSVGKNLKQRELSHTADGNAYNLFGKDSVY